MGRTEQALRAARSPVATCGTGWPNGQYAVEQGRAVQERPDEPGRSLLQGDEAILICDLSGGIVGVNLATTRIFVRTQQDLLGTTILDLFEDKNDLLAALRHAAHFAPEQAIVEQHAALAIDLHGRRIPLTLTLRRLPRSSSSLILTLTVRHDPLLHGHDLSAAPLGRLHAARATTEFQRELIIELVRERGLNGLADSLHQRTGCPAVVFDSERRPVAQAGVRSNERSIVQQLQLALTDVGHGVIMRSFGCWSAAIAPDDRLLGWICLLDEFSGVGNGEWLALEEAVSIVTLELLRLQQLAEVRAVSLRELADQLVTDPRSPRVLALAEALSYDLRGTFQVMVARFARSIEKSRDDWSAFAGEAFRKLGLRSPLVSDFGEGLFLVLPFMDDRSSDEEASHEKVAVALEEVFESDVQVGVGGDYELVDFKRSLQEAVFALAMRDSTRSEQRVTVFADLGFWKFLHDFGESDLLRQVVDEWIGELIVHDAAQRSELVKTLSVYLNESCAAEAAATALYIHRNTLRYRLTKIVQVTGRDLSDPDERFQLQLACRAWDGLQALEASKIEIQNRRG